jgi:serine-type D-Ala-D-Ala carboxypeptidase/endopeptidase (penicillin-binding protein 4)
MRRSRFSKRRLLLSIGTIAICTIPLLWPTVLSVEGHGTFEKTAAISEFWSKVKLMNPAERTVQELSSVSAFKQRLLAEGRDLGMHGVYIESLNEREPLVAFNEDCLFNPASIMKLVTSITALDKLGADYRFRTEFIANGVINQKTGELIGDLVIISGGDPTFSISDANNAGQALRKLGLKKIKGNFVVIGNFNCNENSQTDISAGVLRRNLGLTIQGETILENTLPKDQMGSKLFDIESDSLLRILQEQNAHSINAVAEAVGNAVGGAAAARTFLIDRIGLKEDEVFITRTSGLEANRLTALGTAKMLRGIVEWLKANNFKPEDLMPIAGVDPSTVGGRFTEAGFAGSVIAKTGTLHETDNGAANLAGIAYTKDKGPVLFVIYDMAEGRNVIHLRGVQDEFLKNLMNEFGGPAPIAPRAVPQLAQLAPGKVILNEGN